jgi:hypothetical protein
MDDYKAGKCTADEFRERGISRDELIREIDAERDRQLGELQTVIRGEQMKVLEQQLVLERHKQNLVYLISIPPKMEITFLKAKLTELEGETNSILHDSPAINTGVRQLKHRLAQARAGSITEGRAWYNVTPETIISTIRWDPTVPSHLIPELMKIRQEMIEAGVSIMESPLTLTPRRTTAPDPGMSQDVKMGVERAGWIYSITQARESIHTGDLHE